MKNAKKTSFIKLLGPYLVMGMIIGIIMVVLNFQGMTVNNLSTGKLLTALENNEVKEIVITPKSSESIYYVEGKLSSYKDGESFKTKVVEDEIPQIIEYVQKNDIEKYDTNKDPGSSALLYIVVNVLPIIIVVMVAYSLFNKLASSNKNSMDFGRSKARLSDDKDKKSFKDVAGLKEEKEEVEELIDFLKNPKKFQSMGARIPKGVLLVGPPGTGKTLLAKAIAGEANVPFFYISGSDFVELFVGVGASRVRDMFKEAKRNAPCLIFIDEIDAVGRQRGTGLGGGHDEREQTLPDVLDPALLRPGRFDRQVTVSLPDSNEREAILKVHAKNKILDKSVKLSAIAARTPGFSGADLENLLNEAALLAVRRNKDKITIDEIDEATDRVLLGPAKTTRKITDKEKKLVSLHEAGHAVIGLKNEYAEVVHKITIIPRGMAGGYTMMLPKEEKLSIMTKNELLGRITGLLGGRVSEEHFLHEMSTGASDDFKKATAIARSMVTEYGMSELGPMQYEEREKNVFLGRDYAKSKDFSDQVALEIDRATRKIIDECYEKAKKIVADNEGLIMLLSDALMKYETLNNGTIPSEEVFEETSDESKIKTIDELKEIAKEKKIKNYSKMSKTELEEAIKESGEK